MASEVGLEAMGARSKARSGSAHSHLEGAAINKSGTRKMVYRCCRNNSCKAENRVCGVVGGLKEHKEILAPR